MTRQEIEKRCEELSEKYGRAVAHPELRSMWPMLSRGQMATEFGNSYAAGFNAALDLTWPMVEDALTKFIQMRDGHENYVHKIEAQLMERDSLKAEAERLADALELEGQWLTHRGMLPMPEHIAQTLANYRTKFPKGAE
jgi:hypothetical protein